MPNEAVITLNYDITQPIRFVAVPNKVEVDKGDEIVFKPGTAPANTRFKVTMEPGFFSELEIVFSSKQTSKIITVDKALTGPTVYHCQLIDENTNAVMDKTDAVSAGGGVEPKKK